MALTENNITSTGATTYPFTFPYLKPTDVKVSVDGTAKTYLTHWEFDTPTVVKFKTGHVPPSGDLIRIYRETDDSKLEAQFFAGSAIKSSDLNDNFTQNLYVTQESNNKIDAAWTSGDETIISSETWVSNDNRVSTTAAQDARIDSKIDTALTTDVVGGQSITITDNSPGSGQITASVTAGSIRGTELAGDAVDGTKIADDSINSEHYVDGSIDTQHIANAQVTHDKLANDCIDGDNIQNDVINSEHYVAGSIDTEHIADSQVTTVKIADLNVTTDKIAADAITGAKIADDQIDSEHLVADSIDTEHYAPNSVDTNALGADAVTGAQVADNAIDSEHYVDGSIDADHLAASAVTENKIGDGAVVHTKLASSAVTEAKIASNAVTTAKIAADAIDGTKIADNAIGSEHIAANAVGDSEIATGALDNRYYTKTTSDARYFNISTGDTIKDGDAFPDNDTTIATTAAINDRIIDLVDDVGGFVPIANETSFPNANPDVNNGTGTLVSIKTLASNLTSNGSGVATIANGTVGNSTVTINGLENSTTYSSGYGMIVETTTTLNTYTFHRLVPKATEVTTVAGKATEIGRLGTAAAVEDLGILGTADVVADLAILGTADVVSDLNTLGTSDVVSDMNTLAVTSVVNNMDTCATNVSNINTVGGSISNVNTVASNMSTVNDFAARYRVASSDPSSNNDEGDLVFNTTSNELRVYNGSQWQGGVTATGNLASLGANTFTGAQTFISSQTFDGRDLSVDGAKLDGIEAGATGDQTNAEIRAAVEAASDSNVFTDADHSKLNAIEANATADQTNAEIRAAVEAASDSHVFTDADHSKLNAIEAGATADQTKSEIEALNINADTVDGIHGASFLRSDANDTATGQLTLTSSSQYPLNIDGSNDGKIVLQGSTNPYIRFREGATDKGYLQWNASGYIDLANSETNRHLRIGSANAPEYYDGSSWQILWTQGNDGSGSGLDADTLDGVQGASFLRSDTNDTFTGELTVNNVKLYQNGSTTQNLTVRGYNTQNSNDVGISLYNNNNNWSCQLYGTNGGSGAYYGFLDANWGGWDIKKQANGAFEVDEGSGLKRVLNTGNLGSSGALASTTVYASSFRASDWIYFRNTANGLYWDGGSAGGWHFYPANTSTMGFRAGSTGGCQLALRTTNNTTRGSVYANNSNQIGFLDQLGDWAIRTNRSSNECTIYDQHLKTDTDSTYDIGTNSTRWRNVYADTLYGDGSNITNLPAGGNTIQLTASGSIATNKPVTLNSDGTCSEVKLETTARTVPQLKGNGSFRNTETGGNNGCHDTTHDRIFHGYAPSGNPNDSKQCVRIWGIDSNGNQSGSTEHAPFGEYQRTYPRLRAQFIHDPDTNNVLFFYPQNYGGTGELRLLRANTSNRNIAYSGSTNFTASVSYGSFGPVWMGGCYDTANNKSIVSWVHEVDSYDLRCRVISLSGTDENATITMGTDTLISNGNHRCSDLVYDPDTGKVILVYCRYDSSVFKAFSRVGTVSGNSISWSSEITIDSNDCFATQVTYDTTNNKLVCCYYRSSYLRTRVGTVSGNSISWGSETQVSQSTVSTSTGTGWSNGYKEGSGIAYDDQTDTIAYCYNEGTSIQFRYGYINGSTITMRGNKTDPGCNNTWGMCLFQLIGYDSFFCAFRHQGNNRGYYNIMDTAVVNCNMDNSNKYLGFVESAVSNGQTATILTYGNTTSNLSGLTAGQHYYVQGNGTLGTSVDTSYFSSSRNEPVAGLALSSSKLLINNFMPNHS